jgi:hypothetical protein
MSTYGITKPRRIKAFTVKKLKLPETGEGLFELVMEKDWTVPRLPEEVGERLLLAMPTDVLEYEYVGLSRIVGWRINGEWIRRSSDEDLALEDALTDEAIQREFQQLLDDHREEWTAREKKLPEWLQERLRYFHEQGGDSFLLNGWGYEVVVSELAAMYFEQAPDFEDTDEIRAYEEREGTSANQHVMGQKLARMHYETPERSMAGTTAALPFRGPYYQES